MLQQSGERAIPRLELGVALEEFLLNPSSGLIATQVASIFPTQKKEGKYPAITRESITRDADTKRATDGSYNRDGFEVKDKEFACKEHGLEGPLDDSKRRLYASDFDAELAMSQIVGRRLLQAQEIRVANLIMNPTVFTGTALYKDYSSNPWSNAGTDVVSQMKFARQKIRKNSGLEANTLVMSRTNWDYLLVNNAVKEAIKYTARTTEQVIANALADVLGIDRIIVGNGIRNSSKEGATFSGSDIWSSDYAILGIMSNAGQDLSQPTLARTFLWVNDSPENVTVESYRDEPVRSDVFRVRHHTDEQIIDPYFGFMLKVA